MATINIMALRHSALYAPLLMTVKAGKKKPPEGGHRSGLAYNRRAGVCAIVFQLMSRGILQVNLPGML